MLVVAELALVVLELPDRAVDAQVDAGIQVLVIARRDEGLMMGSHTRLNPQIIASVMKDTFHPMDVLFYGLAIYVGYKYAFKPITDEEMAKLTV